MIPAIVSPTSTPTYSAGGAALQGQLARYEKELSACINCSTAKTTEGKQKIQEVSSQIEQIKARIEQATRSSATLLAEKPSTTNDYGSNSIAQTVSSVFSDSGQQLKSPIGRHR